MSWRAGTPRAVAARSEVARALLQQLLRRDLDGLRGVVSEGEEPWVVVWGDPPPWVDGGLFLGVHDDAPSLFVPTRRTWELPPTLLEARVLAACEPADAPVAWLDDALVPLGAGRALDAEVLRALLEAW